MKTFAEQLQEYVNVSRNEKLNRHNFLRGERIRLINHMFDLLQILGVIKDVRSTLISHLDKHTLIYVLVNKHYKDPR